ncbi:hypothetical protein [Butyrivibrio sp. JL13D10]|uniref:hypothetical protein n=1 Tax=Butyrivibrio sp. JL13D10 TaxID=3236815 RepID=UPI0038B625BF
MKKVWNNAELVELDITATAFGPSEAPVPDGESYYSEEAQSVVIPYGKKPLSESPLR